MKRSLYSEDHEAFRKVIRDFIAREVAPAFSSWEELGYVPREFHKRFGDLGIAGFDIEEEFGGAGPTSYRYHAVITEECARAGVNFGGFIISHGIVLPYLLDLATNEQRQRWFPGLASGDQLSIAMTEPGTGSDLAGIKTSARLSEDGTHYVLNGAKTFITNATQSRYMVVACRTSAATADNRRHGLSLLVVETGTPGFEYGRRLHKIGMRNSDTCEISFTDVKVPVENLLGEEGAGFSYLGRNLTRERLAAATTGCSNAAAAIAFARDYVLDRKVFGQPVASFQNTKFILAECATELEAGQSMVDRAIELEDSGELTAVDAAKCKLFCTEMSGRVIDKCLQLHGGYGYILEYPIARLYADTRVTRIAAGSSEVMKTMISKSLGL